MAFEELAVKTVIRGAGGKAKVMYVTMTNGRKFVFNAAAKSTLFRSRINLRINSILISKL